MATLHLMVGLPGRGKTTLARKLEAEYSALRLTVARNAQPPPGTSHIPEIKLKEWMRVFEPPSADELDS